MSTKDPEVRRCAEGYTKAIEPIVRQSAYDHDLGFIVINSFMKGYEATGKKEYKDIALRAADTLATLFNPAVGTILSWPRHVKDYKGHNTIMDNMINLELLYWAAENGGGKPPEVSGEQTDMSQIDTSKENFTIGFIGGSLTQGGSKWINAVTEFFENKYPPTK